MNFIFFRNVIGHGLKVGNEEMTDAGDDFLAVKLKEIPKDADMLATKTAEFCDTETEAQLKNLQKGVLFLWWD